MPYVKKGARRYKKSASSKRTSMRSVARQEAKKVVTRAIESKTVDQYSNPGGGHGYVNVGASTATGALSQNLVFGLLRGPGQDEFIGSSIKPTKVIIRYSVIAAAGSAFDSYNHVRVLLIQGKGGGIPDIDNILQSTGNFLTPHSPFSVTYRPTFRVLYDKTHLLTSYGGAQTVQYTDSYIKQGIISISGKKLAAIKYSSTSTAPSANNLYLFAVSDSTGGTHPLIGYWCRTWYKDA